MFIIGETLLCLRPFPFLEEFIGSQLIPLRIGLYVFVHATEHCHTRSTFAAFDIFGGRHLQRLVLLWFVSHTTQYLVSILDKSEEFY
jgi:hypothetical protein